MCILISSSLDSVFQLIVVLLIFVFVLFITYITTRWLGGIQKAKSNNKNLQIVETIAVGNNKFVSIIAVGKKYIVVSVGKDEVHMLTQLEEEDLKDLSYLNQTSGMNGESFQEILRKIKDKIPKK